MGHFLIKPPGAGFRLRGLLERTDPGHQGTRKPKTRDAAPISDIPSGCPLATHPSLAVKQSATLNASPWRA